MLVHKTRSFLQSLYEGKTSKKRIIIRPKAESEQNRRQNRANFTVLKVIIKEAFFLARKSRRK